MRRPPARRWGKGAPGFPQSRPQIFDTVIPGQRVCTPLSGRSLQHESLFFLSDFMYFYPGLRWVFLAAWALPPLQRVELLFWAVRGLLTAGLLLLQSPGSERWLSTRGAGLSRSMARVIVPDPGIESCLLHWRADSYVLCHQGSPTWSSK